VRLWPQRRPSRQVVELTEHLRRTRAKLDELTRAFNVAVARIRELEGRLVKLEASPFVENREDYERHVAALREGTPEVPLWPE